MTIYEIENEILECTDEHGEIIDINRLHELVMEREKKIDSVAYWIKGLKVEIEGLKNERDALCTRQKTRENKVKSLEGYLNRVLQGNKFETIRNKISYRRSTAVEIVDEKQIEDKYFKIAINKKVSKEAIKKAIDDGETVAGARLVTNNNIQIK